MEDKDNGVNKNGWMWLAPKYFDQWRIFPRAFIIFYFWLCMETAMWFMGIPNPGPAQAAFASAVVGAGAAWFGLYVNSGTDKTPTVNVNTSSSASKNRSGETYETQTDLEKARG